MTNGKRVKWSTRFHPASSRAWPLRLGHRSPHRPPPRPGGSGPGACSPPLAQSHRDQTRALIRRHVRRGPSAPLPNQPRTRLALTHAPLAGREQSHLRAAHGAYDAWPPHYAPVNVPGRLSHVQIFTSKDWERSMFSFRIYTLCGRQERAPTPSDRKQGHAELPVRRRNMSRSVHPHRHLVHSLASHSMLTSHTASGGAAAVAAASSRRHA